MGNMKVNMRSIRLRSGNKQEEAPSGSKVVSVTFVSFVLFRYKLVRKGTETEIIKKRDCFTRFIFKFFFFKDAVYQAAV